MLTKKFLSACLLAALAGLGCDSGSKAESFWSVAAPNTELRAELRLEGGKASYRIIVEGAPVLEWSPLGLELKGESLAKNLTYVSTSTTRVTEEYTSTVGKRLQRSYDGRKLTLTLEAASERRFQVIFRVHDDAVAFRYRVLGTGSAKVVNENTGFTLPEGSVGWLMPYSDLGLYLSGSYEGTYRRVDAGEADRTIGWAFPGLFQLPASDHYVLLTESDLDERYFGGRLHQSPVGTTYQIRLPGANEAQGIGAVEPEAELPWLMPWRVAIVGHLGEVVASTAADDLARPTALEDTSWIRPGRAAWSWHYRRDTGEPEVQRAHIDFAARMNWEYNLIDAGWDQWRDSYAAVAQLAAHAVTQSVDLWLWYNSGGDHNTWMNATPRDLLLDTEARQKEFARIADMGIVGVKIDFFESDKQDRIRQYIGILNDAAEHRLMVNLHGATIPRGWQRTFPHLLSIEAVKGGEYYQSPIGPEAIEHVRYAYTRNVIGSMDYTPIAFSDAWAQAEIPYVHQLALAVLFESGILHPAEGADEGFNDIFAAYPFVKAFLRNVPVVWDETVFLGGDPDTSVALARRSGKDWYVAAITGLDAGDTMDLALDFLGAGQFSMETISGDGPTGFSNEVQTVTAGGSWTVPLKDKGGALAVISPL